VNSGDKRQTPTTNDTSDERGELEREASSGREDGRELCCPFYRERGRERRSRRFFNGRSQTSMAITSISYKEDNGGGMGGRNGSSLNARNKRSRGHHGVGLASWSVTSAGAGLRRARRRAWARLKRARVECGRGLGCSRAAAHGAASGSRGSRVGVQVRLARCGRCLVSREQGKAQLLGSCASEREARGERE
jgi:hypothetical protein